MNDLYDNLENYHDDKIIDELKNENKDLKAKIEEYSNAMVCLQNHFDELHGEFKKLEMNYSSLLKTARAEIERKSEMIKSLNAEKDQLVINTMQSTGTNILKTRRYTLNNNQQSSKRYGIDSEFADDSQKNKNLLLESNNVEKNLRNQSDDSRKTTNYHRNDVHKTKVNDTKNIYSEDIKCSYSREYTNSNSQKFMRMSRVEPIYSSDDDLEFNYKNRRKSSSREDTGYKSHYNRGKYCSPSRDLYKNSTNQFIDHDKYRHTKYESDRKYRRHSPQKYKDDYNREKKLRVPSPDKYNCRDSRIISEREKKIDNPRHISHHGVAKHKIRNKLEEPSIKRQKFEENAATSDKTIYNTDQEKVPLNKNDLTQLSCCKLPDYGNMDSKLPLHVIKEKKSTATTSLEDPRVSSQKYVLKDREKKVLPALVSKNIDIKPIHVKNFTLPEASNGIELSTVTNNDLVSEININIDKTTLNSQIDSEEIQRGIDNYCNLQANAKICGNNLSFHNKSKEESDTVLNLKECNSNKFRKLVTVTNKAKMLKCAQKSDTVSTNVIKHDGEKLSQKYEGNIDKKGKCSKPTITAQPESSNIKKISDDNKRIEILQKMSNKLTAEKTVVALSTLADDLELSDEANENKDSQKDTLVSNKKSNKTLNKEKAGVTFVDSNEYQSDMPLVKNKLSESKEISDLVNSKKETAIDDKKMLKEFHQGSNKTGKMKEKTNEQNEEPNSILESKEKEHEQFISIQTKNKFSDLFGDSSSLITPDDLGIRPPEVMPLDDKYVSVFDNTQDAVDLNVEDLDKIQSTTIKISKFPNILNELSTNKTVMEQTDNASNFLMSEDSNKNEPDINSSVNVLYNKRELERFNHSSEVVKTLIISSGVQPNTVQYVSPNNKLKNSEINDIEFPNIIHEDKNISKNLVSDIKALATSTPHKFIHENMSVKVSDLNGQHYVDKTNEEINVLSNTSNSSKQIKNEADIPDMRIIVKRRRKIIKKP